jgi:hypothetical protein
MKSQTKTIITSAVLVGVLALSGCASFNEKSLQVVILKEPKEAVVAQGGTATFRVVAKPSSLTYQWYKNGTNVIERATDSVLVIKNVKLADVGFYSCLVTKFPSQFTRPAALFMFTPISVSGPFQPGIGNNPSCIGPYLGAVTFPNPAGGYWFRTPVGETSCTITDTTSLGGGYSSKVESVQYSDFSNKCAVHSLNFPARSGDRYLFTTYVTAGAPPPGTTLTLSYQWLP